jgi:hypothetical protein
MRAVRGAGFPTRPRPHRQTLCQRSKRANALTRYTNTVRWEYKFIYSLNVLSPFAFPDSEPPPVYFASMAEWTAHYPDDLLWAGGKIAFRRRRSIALRVGRPALSGGPAFLGQSRRIGWDGNQPVRRGTWPSEDCRRIAADWSGNTSRNSAAASIGSACPPMRRNLTRSNTSGAIASNMSCPTSARKILPNSDGPPARRWGGCVAVQPWWNPSGNRPNYFRNTVTILCEYQ